ncbi:MAG: ABC transporter ATP-binding protein [Rubellimicrobium sp.]|nr:ABC transporter ATP-binding protein [Rubellimicrobium sp.]
MSELLAVEDLRAGYGQGETLHGISLTLREGESLALLGRNGVGKTTTLNSIMGLTRHLGGRIILAGQDITRRTPEARAWAGLGWVPQERGVFRSLTVEENITAVAQPGRWTLETLYDLFPRLRERRGNYGNQLSGGEQQMLAVARALALNPRVLLLDEPTEGLAPIIVQELLAVIRRIVRDEGVSAIIVEQHARKILGLTDRAVVLDRGAVVWSGESDTLAGDAEALGRHLGVH